MVNSRELEIDAIEEMKPLKNGDYLEPRISIDITKYKPPKEIHWLFRRLFILSWIRDYNREQAVADLISGITCGLTIIPQSIAYASLAGLSSEYGLYSAIIGKLIYVFFGTIPQVSIGPSSLMSLLVLQFVGDRPVQFVVILSFLSGLVEFLMGSFELGFIVNIIPSPVTQAFTTATAVIVALVQVKSLLGVQQKGIPSLTDIWNKFNVADSIMGVSCLTILFSLAQLTRINFKKNTDSTRRLKKFFWYVSISRNAFVICLCATVTFIWAHQHSMEAVPFALSAKVESAKLVMELPPFAFEYNNSTYVFSDICAELGSGIIVVPIVAILANIAIAKAFIKDGTLDASQEMVTLGICNIVGSFFSCMPTCGAFTRSAVSHASGVRTPMAGVYTGLIVLSALGVLTPYFQYIPIPAISAVLIAAVVYLIDFRPLKDYWLTNKKDFLSWLGCFIVCILAGVQMGLLFGIVINMIFVLIRLGLPKVEITLKELSPGYGYIHVTPRSDIYYTGIDFMRAEMCKACILYKYEYPVVLECSRFMQYDATFGETINFVAKELQENHVLLILQNLTPKLHQLMPKTGNVHFCDDQLSIEELHYSKASSKQSFC